MHPAWQRIRFKVGGEIHTAWGLNGSKIREGSFEQLADDHFEALQETVHLRQEPQPQALNNESWGVVPTLKMALISAEEDHTQYMNVQPDQLLVEGSTSAVTRSLLPFVPKDSPYTRMRTTVAREELRALSDLALANHLWVQDGGGKGLAMHSAAPLAATDQAGLDT